MSYWNNIQSIQKSFPFGAPESFIKANGFTKWIYYANYAPIERIIKTAHFASCAFSEQEKIPYLDHPILYKNHISKTCCLVYIPYNNVADIKDEVTKWADSKGLKAEFYEKSWYKPSTCVVIISHPDVVVNADCLT